MKADQLEQGQMALRDSDWESARLAYENALAGVESAEAHDGLGIALWWLNEIPESHRHRAAAYTLYKARGATGKAARIACWLAREQVFLNGSPNAMNGWFARADRLPRCLHDETDRAWCVLYRASMTAPSHTLMHSALMAVETARTYNDANLEAAALAFAGSAQVAVGKVDMGFQHLDEAMTMAISGEANDLMSVSETYCLMLSACEVAGDLSRSSYWCQAAADFAKRNRCQFLSAYCRTTYGSLLMATGHFQEAESSLIEAIHGFDNGHRGLRVHAVLKLADLRVIQGRLEEADVLLTGLEDYGAARLPLARLHLARHNTSTACALLNPVMDEAITLDHFPQLALLVEARLAMGDHDGARVVVRQLETLAEWTQSELVTAQVELAKGELYRQLDEDAALSCFNAAMARLRDYEPSLLMSRTRMAIAQLLADRDAGAALAAVTAALAGFERAGATQDIRKASQLLNSLGVSRRPAPSSPILTAREEDVLSLLAYGLTNREIASRLVISAKTVEHHVGQILSKLGLRNRAEAAAFANRTGAENRGSE